MKNLIFLFALFLFSCQTPNENEIIPTGENEDIEAILKKIDFDSYLANFTKEGKISPTVYIFEVSGVERCLFKFEKSNTTVYPNFTSYDIRMYGHGAGMALIRRFDDLYNYTSPFKVPFGYYAFESYESNRPKRKIKRQFVLPLTSYVDVKNIFDKIVIKKGYRNVQWAVDYTDVNFLSIKLVNGKPVINRIFKKRIMEREFELEINL